MSRHNRRRTRGTHKNYNLSTSLSPFSGDRTTLPTQPPLPSPQGLTTASFRRLSGAGGGGGSGVAARHWHNRYLAWQTRERRQREERAALEAEKKRIFGEASGEDEGDEGLCERMMEYFWGLDFIEG
ncbi:hypothetical protein MMC30_004333 [Trapelia coarctata]|nr:hypothetical protein [Trapelia coarctata]